MQSPTNYQIMVQVEYEGKLETLHHSSNLNEQYVKEQVDRLKKDPQYKNVYYQAVTYKH